MFKLKPEELKAHVLERWAIQFGIDQSTDEYDPPSETRIVHSAIYRNIKTLPKDCVRHQIDNIIGNKGWTQRRCSFCGKLTPLTGLVQTVPVRVDDFYRAAVYICEDCVSVATDIIKLG